MPYNAMIAPGCDTSKPDDLLIPGRTSLSPNLI